MASTLHLKITTPEKVIFESDVEKVSLPTSSGEITVLPHHEPVVSVLKAGELRIAAAGAETVLAVGGGYIEVRPDSLTVLADAAERVEELAEEKIKEAQMKAEKLMAEKLDEEGFAEAQAVLERSLAQLKVLKKYRHRGHRGEHSGILSE